MRIGMLTGPGDCPGLNAVIRAVVRNGIDGYGDQIVGFRDGWRGLVEGSYIDLDSRSDHPNRTPRRSYSSVGTLRTSATASASATSLISLP